jgi:hypothetical protein
MKPQSAKHFVLCSLIPGAVHFAVALLFGYLVLFHSGFSLTPARKLYEAAFGAGIVYLGLPDNFLGFICNSMFYGIASMGIVHLGQRLLDKESIR